ncbi:hypothetical protein HN51_009512 [Arachis hypogaea]
MEETPLLVMEESTSEADYMAVKSFKDVKFVLRIETVKLWKIAAPMALSSLFNFLTISSLNIYAGHLGDINDKLAVAKIEWRNRASAWRLVLGSGAEIVSCLWEERSECVVASSLAVSGGKEHLIFSAFGDVEDECEAIQVT